MYNENDSEEDDENFNFTEIKAPSETIDDLDDEPKDDIPFEYNELKVDLPSSSKKDKIINFFFQV